MITNSNEWEWVFMKKIGFGMLLFGLVLVAQLFPVAAASDEGINVLQKSDSILFPDQAQFVFRMEDYEKGEFKRYHLEKGYIKGNDRYLLIGLEPALVKGTAQLRIGDAIFNYLKKVDVLQQVSAKVAFGNSTLTQEDVMGGKLENFYKVENCTTGKEKDQNVYVLTLTAKTKEVAYQKIISYIDVNTFYPVKREYFAVSGQKVREMIYENIELKDEKLAELKFTMYDTLRKGFYSKVVINEFDYSKAIPDTYFTRMYLKMATK